MIDITEFYSERGGGVRSHLTAKGHVLCQLGHDHMTIAPGPEDAGYSLRGAAATKNAPRVIRIRGPSLPYDPTYHLFARLGKIHRTLHELAPDIVEINSPYFALAAGLRLGAEHVRTFFWHADFLDTYLTVPLAARVGDRSAAALMSPLWKLFRTAINRFDTTFVAGRGQRDKLLRLGFCNVVHVPFGVDKHLFSPGRRDLSRRRARLHQAGMPEDAALVVAVGRMATEKRWDVLLEGFFRMRESGIRALLLCFGDGPERTKLEALARGRADVVFAGFEKDREQLARELASADLYLHACPYETFGLGTAEAMASGLPVVVPDEGGASEGLGFDSACVYKSLSPDALAHAACEILMRDRDRLREAGSAHAKQVRDAREHFEEVLKVYASLLEKRRR